MKNLNWNKIIGISILLLFLALLITLMIFNIKTNQALVHSLISSVLISLISFSFLLYGLYLITKKL